MIITLAQRKGGSGKSTIVASLAAKLAEEYKVAVLDTDGNRTITKWGNRRVEFSKKTNIEVKYSRGDVIDIIQAMYSRNDILIIDTAGEDSVERRHALLLSDIALCPYKPKQFDLEGCVEMRNVITEITTVNTKLKSFSLINSASTHARDSRAANAKKYLQNYDLEVFDSMAYNREAWGDCTEEGFGVSEYEDKLAANEIEEIATELLSHG